MGDIKTKVGGKEHGGSYGIPNRQTQGHQPEASPEVRQAELGHERKVLRKSRRQRKHRKHGGFFHSSISQKKRWFQHCGSFLAAGDKLKPIWEMLHW